MVKRLKAAVRSFRRFLPQNKLRADYNNMVRRLKTLEAQVDDSAQQLELAKSSFLKNIYHEVRTPLNSIMGFTNLLNRDHLMSDQERDEYVGLINKSSREFLRKMDDIIQASLLDANMIKINNESCNLGTFFKGNHSFFSVRKHMAEKNNVALLLSMDESIMDVDFVCDKFRLTQIITQLIDNAFKHTSKGVVEYGGDVKGDMIEFFVRDTATSYIEGKEDVIFKSFSKVEENNDKSGLGLGLSICKSLVELMGGKIWVETKKGFGSSFYFSVPFISPEFDDVTETSEENKKNESVLISSSNRDSVAV